MRAGDLGELSTLQRRRLDEAIRAAQVSSGLTFSVYLGRAADDSRGHAIALHAELSDPDRSVFVLCDPEQRVLEIVTGRRAKQGLKDVDCRLAAASMQTSFAGGDLVGGLVTGVQQLGRSARQPQTLHGEKVTA